MTLTLTLTACSSSDEKTITRLTNNDTRDEYPSWSTDGSKIAFSKYIDDNVEIYVMDY